MSPRYEVELAFNDKGSPINRVVLKERDNKGLLGAHYDPSTMSLRSRLNMGIQFQPVYIGMTENDPNKVNLLVKNFSHFFNSLIQARQAASQEPNVPDSDPSSNSFKSE